MHELKTLRDSFQAVWDGTKTYEVRRADRDFRLWNVLLLREWDDKKQKYTGREVAVNIKYITAPGTFGLPADVCVLGISVYQKIDAETPTRKKKV